MTNPITPEDDMLREAVKVFLGKNQVSTALLQRTLRIGYAQAAGIVATLEKMRVVSMFDAMRPRKLCIKSILEFDDIVSRGGAKADDSQDELEHIFGECMCKPTDINCWYWRTSKELEERYLDSYTAENKLGIAQIEYIRSMYLPKSQVEAAIGQPVCTSGTPEQNRYGNLIIKEIRTNLGLATPEKEGDKHE